VTTPALDPHTTAIVAALDAVAGLVVGDGRKPTGGGWQAGQEGVGEFVGYLVVYQLPAVFDGSTAEPTRDLDGTWQITSVGCTRQQASDVADTARTWLCDQGRTISIAGRTVIHVVHTGDAGVRRDDSTQPPLFYGVDRYLIRTTPT
jgi:hypothetical protein